MDHAERVQNHFFLTWGDTFDPQTTSTTNSAGRLDVLDVKQPLSPLDEIVDS